MCGIIGNHIDSKKSNEEIDYLSLVRAAYLNRHRGADDGFGIIDLDRGAPNKWLYTLDEIHHGSLLRSRGEKKQQVGIVNYVGFDEAYFNERNEKFKKLATSIKALRSQSVIFHHRSASTGDRKIKNTHPIQAKVGGQGLYVHNGSVFGALTLGRWLAREHGWEFDGETDTEVIGNIVEYLLKKNKGDGHEVFDALVDVMYGWGVIVRVSKDYKTIEIFKDVTRPLWFYIKDGHTFYISEPLPEIDNNYTALYFMKEGYYKVGTPFDEDTFDDFTDSWKQTRVMWKKAVEDGCEVRKHKCDDCKEEKTHVIRLPYEKNTRQKMTDVCFPCWIEDQNLAYGFGMVGV